MTGRIVLALVLIVTVLTGTARPEDCVAAVVRHLGRAAPADADAVLRIGATFERGNPRGDGLLAALASRPEDGARRVHQIIDLFPDKTAEVFERLSLVRHVTPDEGGFGALVVNLAKSPTDAQGAWLTLRYVTTKMDPARVAAFERNISGKVVDAADDAGNLLEFKSLNLDSYTDFVARQEFTQIRDQGLVFQAFAEANNKEFRLVFERPVPTKFQDLFDELIQPLLDKPNVVFESSFP